LPISFGRSLSLPGNGGGTYEIFFHLPMLSGQAVLSLQLHRMLLQMLLNRKGNGKGKKKSFKRVFQSKVFHGLNPLHLCHVSLELVGKTLKAAKNVIKLFLLCMKADSGVRLTNHWLVAQKKIALW